MKSSASDATGPKAHKFIHVWFALLWPTVVKRLISGNFSTPLSSHYSCEKVDIEANKAV